MQVFKSTLLLLEKDYVVQRPVNLLTISRKQLQLNIDKANKKLLPYQLLVVAIRKEKTI